MSTKTYKFEMGGNNWIGEVVSVAYVRANSSVEAALKLTAFLSDGIGTTVRDEDQEIEIIFYVNPDMIVDKRAELQEKT